MNTQQIIGLIAGNGSFPEEFIQCVKDAGSKVFVVALEGEANPEQLKNADFVHWVKVGQVGKLLKLFSENNIKTAAFTGGIKKVKLFSGISFDLEALALLAKARSFKDDVILRKVAEELEKSGTNIISATRYLKKSVPEVGKITSRKFSSAEEKDAILGMEAARGIGVVDIGQSVVVYQEVVVAVEAVDGTDATILRGGAVALTSGTFVPGKGAVLVKVAKPQQDLRFDLPAIGPETIKNCVLAGVTAIALEAGKSVILEREKVVEMADQYKLAIAAY